ncbi:aminoacyl-histidine dipeptidase [Butyricicoccus sp. Marseille-Q5471]|uniref:aminoacyl-histidine dipeptidase n=1 Tax=Butyricicoccus sp. Marseille-Q5471 TaxID=3039493 RepID=UPI0024BC5024|nr:aminoacyl-histidine dipeptidase [Butyricicoccus sp. Marseille-Q5471]
MSVLDHLEPRGVFRFFEELCAIPHGSTHTKAISDWCVAFAEARGLEHWQDAANNVVIIGKATPGYENAETIILQGHLDMVCEKAADCEKDMTREGLDLAIDGDYVYAKGTTLGGDDGIAVAMALAILDDASIPHPRIEAVFTTDEEIGMVGAEAMDMSPLKGRKLLNIDSEVEGILTVSCAGGNTSLCTLPVSRAAFTGTALSVTVDGLRGGHSGVEIDKGRANASVLCGRVLWEIGRKTDMRLVSVAGGLKDNAIPAAATAQVVVADEQAARAAASDLEKALQNEFRVTDPAVRVTVQAAKNTETPMDEDSTARAVCVLTCMPNGIQTMSADIAGLVQTSLNLGVLNTRSDCLQASFCVRSSVATEKEMLKNRLVCLMEQLGGTVTFAGDYPAWEYKADSALRELMTAVFREQYGRDPKIEAIHAGLECGLFSGKLPGLDCVSIGPDMHDIHTPRERLSIASTQRVWKYVLEVLKRSK